MSLRISCRTRFDITATGIKNNFFRNRVPLVDDAGVTISDETQWHRSRNQQRNWETINQIISLRTLPSNISSPQRQRNQGQIFWHFEFEIERESDFSAHGDRLSALKRDCEGVPMIIGLDEDPGLDPVLDPGQNVFFDIL